MGKGWRKGRKRGREGMDEGGIRREG